MAVQRWHVGKADIGIVHAEIAALIVIGRLDKGADIVGDRAGIENTELLGKIGRCPCEFASLALRPNLWTPPP